MIKLKNIYGETYYMTEEVKGTACGCDYTEIYLYSEDLGEEYGTYYRNAVNHSQPNIWTPYELKDDVLIVYDDYSKKYSYKYTLVK